MPPRRAIGVTAEAFRALQRQIEALQEQMRRGMNLTVRDEIEDEREEGKVNQEEQKEEVLNPEEEKLFKALTKNENLELKAYTNANLMKGAPLNTTNSQQKS